MQPTRNAPPRFHLDTPVDDAKNVHISPTNVDLNAMLSPNSSWDSTSPVRFPPPRLPASFARLFEQHRSRYNSLAGTDQHSDVDAIYKQAQVRAAADGNGLGDSMLKAMREEDDRRYHHKQSHSLLPW